MLPTTNYNGNTGYLRENAEAYGMQSRANQNNEASEAKREETGNQKINMQTRLSERHATD